MLLITGGTGFIGRHLLDRLSAANIPTRCLTRGTGFPFLQAEFVRGDLVTGAGLADALHGVDTVIHLAGVTKALRPGDYYAGNGRATETLVRAIAGKPIRLIHVSSLAAAGPATGGVPLDEDAPPHPVSHYGKSKLEAEFIVRKLVPDAVIVRPPVVYGPRDTDVFQVLRSVARGWSLAIGRAERWFSALYVSDLVEALVALAFNSAGAGRTYYLAHPLPVSWRDLAETAGRIMGVRPRHVAIPPRIAWVVGYCSEMWSFMTRKSGIISRDKIAEALYPNWTCTPRRAAAEFGWEAATSLEIGLAKTLAWYKESDWLKY
jgi:nucleoside-diphosphate-sugar epimerase